MSKSRAEFPGDNHDLTLNEENLRQALSRERKRALEQIQFLPGLASVLTTERYLRCKQNPEKPVNNRAATGITVFSGMLGVTLFGLFLTPVFYVALRTWTRKEFRKEWEAIPTAPSLPFYCTNRLLADGRKLFLRLRGGGRP